MTINKLNKLEPTQDYVLKISKSTLSYIFPHLNLTRFLEVLEKGIRVEPFPCSTKIYGDIYRRASLDGQWLAMSFIKDAEIAAATSRFLWSLTAGAKDRHEKMILKFHAVEKADEATSILDLLDLTFEGVIDSGLREELQKLVPNYQINQSYELPKDLNLKLNVALIDYLHINLTSIRLIILLLLQSSGISQHCLRKNRSKAITLSNSILSKRMSLFAITSRIINEQIVENDHKKEVELFSRCLFKINNQTAEEPIDFIYHSRFGTYP